MKIRVALFCEGGVESPTQTIEVDDDSTAEAAARAWAMGQTGHPWDGITVETEDGDCFEIEI